MVSSKKWKLLVVAGEASADHAAAVVLRELQQILPDRIEAVGVGGERLAALGMEIIVPASKLNVVGFFDWVDRVGEILGAYRSIVGRIESDRPDLALLVDLPDFNLRIAKRLKRLGVPVAYYISPQVWAWRQYRVKKIRRLVDRMLVVFPFEKEFYERHGVDARFVGHPLLEQIFPRASVRSREEMGDQPRIALLPGSRASELRYHAPILRSLIEKLRERYPRAEIRIPLAPTLSMKEVALLEGRATLVTDARDTLAWADAAAIASGTATLEAALVGTPFCLFYRMNRVTAAILRRMIVCGFVGMPNLLLKKEAAREFLQDRATGELLFEELVRLIEDDTYRSEKFADWKSCRRELESGGANHRAAAEVAALLARPSTGGHGFEPAPVAT